MTVTGDTKSLELPDLLQNFEAHQRSCTLVLTTETGKAHLYMREGKIAAFATDGRASLADLIAAWRLVTPRHLEEARRKKRKSRKSLVEILVQGGAVAADKLRAAAEAALVEDVSDLIATGTKSFEFSNDEEPPALFDADELALQLGIAVSATLLEAARRTDHWTMIRKSIPSDTATFIARDHVELPSDLEDPALGEQLMLALDGTRNVAEAANLFPHARLQAYECLARFVRDRLVRAAAAEDLVVVAGSLEPDAPEQARRVIARRPRSRAPPPQPARARGAARRAARRTEGGRRRAQARGARDARGGRHGAVARGARPGPHARPGRRGDPRAHPRARPRGGSLRRSGAGRHATRRALPRARPPRQGARGPRAARRGRPDLAREIRLELSRSQVDSGDPEAAVDGLTRHGKKLVSREEYVDAHQVYEEVLTIGPTHKAAKVALEMIDKQIFAQRRERRRRIKRFAVAALAGVALGALLTLEVAARIDLVRTTRLVAPGS